MEASVSRAFMKPTHRHLLNKLLLSRCHPLRLSLHPSTPLFLPICQQTHSFSNPNSHARNHIPKWNPSIFTPSSFQSSNNAPISSPCFARILSGHNDNPFKWKLSADSGEVGFIGEDKRAAVTVVLLGWLGSEQKHLRRYAEMYNLFGMNAITFATTVSDVLGLDLGRKMERRIGRLTDELVSWLEEKEKDGKEGLLIFHTFSNTGWLAYGSILNRLQGRPELLEKIKGCVVDSGADPELDPKVWAAGFCTAMLKKQSSADDKEQSLIEGLLFALFDRLFTYLFQIPDVHKRLRKITSTLSKNQPLHPQLYLYSRADKVIPSHKIESFADHQRELGRKVTTFDFESTPHVDHYRTFPDTYQSLIQNFLKDCFAAQGKQLGAVTSSNV